MLQRMEARWKVVSWDDGNQRVTTAQLFRQEESPSSVHSCCHRDVASRAKCLRTLQTTGPVIKVPFAHDDLIAIFRINHEAYGELCGKRETNEIPTG